MTDDDPTKHVANAALAGPLRFAIEPDPTHPLAYRVAVSWHDGYATRRVNPTKRHQGGDASPTRTLATAIQLALDDLGLREPFTEHHPASQPAEAVAETLLDDLDWTPEDDPHA